MSSFPGNPNSGKSNIDSLDINAASEAIRGIILEEISPFLEEIKKRNPNINEEELVERYLKYLRRLGDPRTQFLSDLYYKKLGASEADQAVEVVKSRTEFRSYILQCLKGNENEDKPSELPVKESHALRGAVIGMKESELINILSVKERRKLNILIYSFVLSKMGLMTGELIPSLKEPIESLYLGIEEISQGLITGDQSIGLMIIAVFGYEAYVKIKEQGLKAYLKYNKGDVVLNCIGVFELGTIIKDIYTGEVHLGIAAVLRSLRAARLLKVLGTIPSVRDLYESISEAAPGVVKITGIYAAISFLVMVMLTQVTKGHIEEFSTLGGSLAEMRNLFYADGFQDVLSKIENSTSMDTISKIAASILANGYQLLSSTFYFAIPTALFADLVNKSGVRIEQLAALTLERVDKVLKLVEKLGTEKT